MMMMMMMTTTMMMMMMMMMTMTVMVTMTTMMMTTGPDLHARGSDERCGAQLPDDPRELGALEPLHRLPRKFGLLARQVRAVRRHKPLPVHEPNLLLRLRLRRALRPPGRHKQLGRPEVGLPGAEKQDALLGERRDTRHAHGSQHCREHGGGGRLDVVVERREERLLLVQRKQAEGVLCAKVFPVEEHRAPVAVLRQHPGVNEGSQEENYGKGLWNKGGRVG